LETILVIFHQIFSVTQTNTIPRFLITLFCVIASGLGTHYCPPEYAALPYFYYRSTSVAPVESPALTYPHPTVTTDLSNPMTVTVRGEFQTSGLPDNKFLDKGLRWDSYLTKRFPKRNKGAIYKSLLSGMMALFDCGPASTSFLRKQLSSCSNRDYEPESDLEGDDARREVIELSYTLFDFGRDAKGSSSSICMMLLLSFLNSLIFSSFKLHTFRWKV
jgi:hypothetical protein